MRREKHAYEVSGQTHCCCICLQDCHRHLKEDVALTYEYVTEKRILVNFYMLHMNLLIGTMRLELFFVTLNFLLLSF